MIREEEVGRVEEEWGRFIELILEVAEGFVELEELENERGY